MAASNPFIKQYLMTAGPTPVPPEVISAMSGPVLYHRAPAFMESHANVLRLLKRVFQTDDEVLMFAASGTGALESAAANLAAEGRTALVASCGKFGERWKELCDAYAFEAIHLQIEWGRRVTPEELDRVLAGAEGKVDVVFTTQSETSTGVVNDIEALTKVAHDHGAIICVDAVSGLGAVEIKTAQWGVDVVVAGSQKALMCPPGLAFAAVNAKAMELTSQSPGGSYYFNWQKTLSGQLKEPPSSPFTPAVTLVAGLNAALGLIECEGLESVFARHAALGLASRQAAKALGLELFGPEDENANVVTAITVPEGIDGGALVKSIREKYGVTFAGGQNELKGKIVRIAHCGYYGAFDVLVSLSALELALADMGAGITIGAGVARAQEVFAGCGAVAAVE